MVQPLSDQDQTRLAIAAFVVALARTLGDKDESFSARLNTNLEAVYWHLSDAASNPTAAMETVRWAQQMIYGVRY
jgi:hypothetical protein